MHVGIVGGTGRLGRGLAGRLARGGVEVSVLGRDPNRTEAVVSMLTAAWDVSGLRAARPTDAGNCDVVVLSVPAGAVAGHGELLDSLGDRTVLSPVNDIGFSNGECVSMYAKRHDSVVEQILGLAPALQVATAFNHVPADVAGDPDIVLDADVAIASSSPRGLADATAVVESVAGLRGVHVGSLVTGREVEAFTAVLVNANRNRDTSCSLGLVDQRR